MLYQFTSDYLAAVRRLWVLDNPTTPEVITELDLVDFINEAREEVAIELLCIPYKDAIAWPAGTATLSTLYGLTHTIDTAYWGKTPIKPIFTRDDYYTKLLDATPGTPRQFWMCDDLKSIFLYPTPDVSETLNVFGFNLPEKIVVNPETFAIGGSTGNGSATVTAIITEKLNVGMPITGTGIPANTLLSQVLSVSSILMDHAATATNAGAALTFTRYTQTVETQIPLIARRAVPFWALQQIYNRDPFNEEPKTKAAYFLQLFNQEMGKAKARKERARHMGKGGKIVPQTEK